MKQTRVLIIGAGPAGLALAGCLKKAAIDCLLIEKGDRPGASWQGHYDRLHLHTPKTISTLPYLSYKPGVPRYPSRDQFIDYLADYCNTFGISPVCHTEVRSVAREGRQWTIHSSGGTFQSSFLIFATGKTQAPRRLSVSGIAGFTGQVLHSREYRTGAVLKGKKVLVVGFGNSACEMAMDLYDNGATPVMSVRSPVNIIPRDLFGIPVLYWSTLLSHLPARTADRISAPLLRLALGNLAGTGLTKAGYGPSEQVQRLQKIPAIDIGALRYIRQGKIRVTGEIKSLSGPEVIFAGGQRENFDVILAATGYDALWPEISGLPEDRVADLKKTSAAQIFFGRDALYSCGFGTSGTGMIRSIGKEAMHIAADIAFQLKQ